MKRFFAVAIALALASASATVAAQEYSYDYDARGDVSYDNQGGDEYASDRYDDGYASNYDRYEAGYDRYDDRNESRYDDRDEARYEDRYDNRYHDRYSYGYDDRYDNRCDGRYRGDSATPILGAILGGAIGNQFGHGDRRTAATVAGAALGYGIASNSNGRCNDRYPDHRGYGYGGYSNGLSIRIGSYPNYGRGYGYYDRYRHSRRHRNRH